MSLSATDTPTTSRAARIVAATPLFGPLVREISRDVEIVFYLLVIAVTALVLAVKLWGLAALTMTALALVPVIFVLLIWTTLP